MTQEDKELFLKDLCARLPYRVKINCFDVPRTLESISIDCDGFVTIDCGGEHFYHPLSNILHKDCLPYLRPMSSMTEEEKKELKSETCQEGTGYFNEQYLICPISHFGEYISYDFMSNILNLLNANYFDYRGLIEKGLALEAPEDMYNTKIK